MKTKQQPATLLPSYETLMAQLEAVGGAGSLARAEVQPLTWPRNAAEVREFMDTNCQREERANDDSSPSDDDLYALTAHDFLSAVNRWADSHYHPGAPQPAAPAQAAPVGMEPVATVTCEGVMGVSFTSSSSYGCDLVVGTKLYTAAQVQAMLAGAPTPPLTHIGNKP